MNAEPETLKRNLKDFTDEITLSMLASLDSTLDAETLPDDVRAPAVDAYVDAAIAVGAARQTNAGAFGNPHVDWMAPFRATLSSECVARAMLNIPAPVSLAGLAQAATRSSLPNTLAEQPLATQMASLIDMMKPKAAMSLGKARDSYVARLVEAHGPDYHNLGTYRNAASAFIALCGDKPVNHYGEADVQHFYSELAYLPPNFTKKREWRAIGELTFAVVRPVINENRRRGGQGLKLGTIEDKFVGTIKTLIGYGYDDRGLLVEAADQMEQELAAGLRERQVAELVQDHEVEAAEVVGHTALAASSLLTRSTTLKNRPRAPSRMQARAIAMAKWVLPVPVPPTITTLR